MSRRSSLSEYNLSRTSFGSPNAESTKLCDDAKSSSKFPWGGVPKRKANSPLQNSKSIFKTNSLSMLKRIDPHVYTDTQSHGLASRIVKYHEMGKNKNEKSSLRANYKVPGDFPIVNLKKKNIIIKPSPSKSDVNIAPPDESICNVNLRSSILRNGNTSINEPLKPASELEIIPTKSVLDVLTEISRKRINNEELGIDSKKKPCSESTSDQIDYPILMKKRQWESTVSLNSDNQVPKRDCIRSTRNNDILSSLSSSISMNKLKNSEKNKSLQYHINNNSKGKEIKPILPVCIQPTAKQSLSCPVITNIEKPGILAPSLSALPPAFIKANIPPKSKLTLFNRNYDDIDPKLMNRNEKPDDNFDLEINFVKPKDSLVTENSTLKMSGAEKNKLAVMLSCLRSDDDDDDDDDDNDDVVDALSKDNTEKSISVPVQNISNTPVQQITPPILTTKDTAPVIKSFSEEVSTLKPETSLNSTTTSVASVTPTTKISSIAPSEPRLGGFKFDQNNKTSNDKPATLPKVLTATTTTTTSTAPILPALNFSSGSKNITDNLKQPLGDLNSTNKAPNAINFNSALPSNQSPVLLAPVEAPKIIPTSTSTNSSIASSIAQQTFSFSNTKPSQSLLSALDFSFGGQKIPTVDSTASKQLSTSVTSVPILSFSSTKPIVSESLKPESTFKFGTSPAPSNTETNLEQSVLKNPINFGSSSIINSTSAISTNQSTSIQKQPQQQQQNKLQEPTFGSNVFSLNTQQQQTPLSFSGQSQAMSSTFSFTSSPTATTLNQNTPTATVPSFSLSNIQSISKPSQNVFGTNDNQTRVTSTSNAFGNVQSNPSNQTGVTTNSNTFGNIANNISTNQTGVTTTSNTFSNIQSNPTNLSSSNVFGFSNTTSNNVTSSSNIFGNSSTPQKPANLFANNTSNNQANLFASPNIQTNSQSSNIFGGSTTKTEINPVSSQSFTFKSVTQSPPSFQTPQNNSNVNLFKFGGRSALLPNNESSQNVPVFGNSTSTFGGDNKKSNDIQQTSGSIFGMTTMQQPKSSFTPFNSGGQSQQPSISSSSNLVFGGSNNAPSFGFGGTVAASNNQSSFGGIKNSNQPPAFGSDSVKSFSFGGGTQQSSSAVVQPPPNVALSFGGPQHGEQQKSSGFNFSGQQTQSQHQINSPSSNMFNFGGNNQQAAPPSFDGSSGMGGGSQNPFSVASGGTTPGRRPIRTATRRLK